jgi:hypothetical protein
MVAIKIPIRNHFFLDASFHAIIMNVGRRMGKSVKA